MSRTRSHLAPDPRRPLGRHIADLHATAGKHRDRVAIRLVARFGAELDRLARRAQQNLEATVAAIGIGMGCSNDGHGEFRRHDGNLV